LLPVGITDTVDGSVYFSGLSKVAIIRFVLMNK
jgi:streptogramin lyase